jgi:hypothetical protein
MFRISPILRTGCSHISTIKLGICVLVESEVSTRPLHPEPVIYTSHQHSFSAFQVTASYLFILLSLCMHFLSPPPGLSQRPRFRFPNSNLQGQL